MPAGRQDNLFVREEDASGQPSEHFRIVDTLGTMLCRGTITSPMCDAGTRFAEDFHSAGLEGTRAIDYGSAGGGSASTDSMTERVAMAQHRLGKAMDSVGGIESPGGSALWGIIGLGMSVSLWASTNNWGNREVKGLVISSFFLLVRHYGYLAHSTGHMKNQHISASEISD